MRGAAGERSGERRRFTACCWCDRTLREDSDRLPRPSRSREVLLPGAGNASQRGRRRLGRHRLRAGLRELAFQRATEWVPPRWPDPARPQQLHLDIRVDDADQPGRSSGRLAPLVRQVSLRQGSGSSSTPFAASILHRLRSPQRRLNRRPHISVGRGCEGRSLELLVQIGSAACRSQLVERACDPIVGGIRRPGANLPCRWSPPRLATYCSRRSQNVTSAHARTARWCNSRSPGQPTSSTLPVPWVRDRRIALWRPGPLRLLPLASATSPTSADFRLLPIQAALRLIGGT